MIGWRRQFADGTAKVVNSAVKNVRGATNSAIHNLQKEIDDLKSELESSESKQGSPRGSEEFSRLKVASLWQKTARATMNQKLTVRILIPHQCTAPFRRSGYGTTSMNGNRELGENQNLQYPSAPTCVV